MSSQYLYQESALAQTIPEEGNDLFPASFAQEALWFLDQLEADSASYNLIIPLRLKGYLNVALLEQSVQALIERHEVLRTTLVPLEGLPMQAIRPRLSISMPVCDLREVAQKVREQKVEQLASQAIEKPFDLATGPLLRAHLLRLADTEHVLVITLHHVIMDGWSSAIFVRDLKAAYNALMRGEALRLPELPVQYADYAVWQRELLAGDTLHHQVAYWRQQLADAPALLELPTDYPRPVVRTHVGARYSTTLPAQLSESLHAYSRREGASLFMTLLAAFQVLLARYSGQDDIVVGTPIAGRVQAELENVLGLFSNTLALRTHLADDPPFSEFLKRVRRTCLEAYEHQDVPFEQLVERLQHERSHGMSPVFQALFSVQNVIEHALEFVGLETSALDIAGATARFDLTCDMLATTQGMLCSWEYRTDLFEEATIEQMAAHFQRVLEGIVVDPQRRLSQLPLLNPAEQERLRSQWQATQSAYPENECLHTLFEAQVRRTPEAVALIDEAQCLTYAALDTRADEVAEQLRRRGVGPETLVGLYLERSVDLLICLLGVLKAGGAYVPLDPDYPTERLAFVAENAQMALLLTQQRLLERLPPCGCQVVCIDREWTCTAQTMRRPEVQKVQPANLAYVLYTSGSTGRPKGVQIPHQALVNFMMAMQQQPGLHADDVLLAMTSLSFDIAALELFLPLLVGARLHLLPREVAVDGVQLAQRLQHSGATVLQATPTSWQVLVVSGWHGGTGLKMLCGGEALPQELAIELVRRGGLLWNMYGPTETTIWSSLQAVQKVPEHYAVVPIGRAIANTQLYVLDTHLRHVLPGVVGELYIGGLGLARGYQGRPDLTAERFVPNPFSTSPGERIYRTGDRVRFHRDGTLEYLGRLDDQVKLRGYRVELGEIEAILRQQPSISQVVCIVREDQPGDKRLVAYLVFQPDAPPFAPSALREVLLKHLPDYMLPATFVSLASLPLTPNGKVDRRTLPAPDWAGGSTQVYIPPRTITEELLVEVWRELLHVEHVGVQENFFELGGHSLLGVQLIARIAHLFSVNLPLRVLFDAPTIAELAATIVQQQGEKGSREESQLSLPAIVPDAAGRMLPFPLTDIQQAYWIGRSTAFELGNVATHSYSEWESDNLDLERFEYAWQRLIERHEMLRAVVLPDGQQQILTAVPPYQINVQDLRQLPPERVEAALATVRQELSHQMFAADRWPLFELRASLLDGERVRMHLSADLLMVDAWSWQILSRTLSQFYRNPNLDLPPLTLSFRDYVLAETAWRESELYRRAREYWWQRLPDLPPAPGLPLAQNPAALAQPHFKRRSHRLPPETWNGLKRRAVRYGLTPTGTLLAAFATVLGTWSKHPRFTINLTLFNRPPVHAQINDIVGDFTSLTLLAVDLTVPAPFAERAREVQRQLWEDLEHRYVSGVAVLRELARLHGNPAGAAMPIVFTSALGLPASPVHAPQEEQRHTQAVYSITQTSQVWLDHQVWEEGEALAYSWDAVEELFPPGLLDDVFDAYNRLLAQLAAETQWETLMVSKLVPEYQLEQRAIINATTAPLSTDLLHTLFASQAASRPEQAAVVTPLRTLSYREVARRAQRVALLLRRHDVQPNQLVAIIMEKGWEQVVAALGVLYAGAAYLPIDSALPQERLHYLLQHGEVRVVLTQSQFAQNLNWPLGIASIAVDQLDGVDQELDGEVLPRQCPEDLAYVIYTSGSTGLPKGVMIDHRGAVNTILDLNERFSVGAEDRVLALSSLSFDLSVYDIFGILAAGGTIVMPAAEASNDPAHWISLLEKERITIWNSVPALMELVVEQAARMHKQVEQELRLVMLSGDWIPVSLPERICSSWKQAEVISLGGATEASIWSILFPITQVEPDWKSIPYGHPMRNQAFHVLNTALEPCPVWVPGELYIGGIGLARGYWRDAAKTEARFFVHPRTGERLYRTGDLGRYLPSGEIEFLGREDFQVKIRGYRIELGEIEAVLGQQAGVAQVVVVVREDSPGHKRLVAYVVPAPDGPLPTSASLRQTAQERLPEYMVPSAFVILAVLPLTANGKVDRRSLPAPERAADEEEERAVLPRTATEALMLNLWKKVLGVEQPGVNDNFFDLGGHSLLGVQLMMLMLETFQIRLQLRTLFEHPTIAALSVLVDQAAPAGMQAVEAVPVASSPDIEAEAESEQGVSPSLLHDLVQRNHFKERQPGLRKDLESAPALPLIDADVDEAVYRGRRSARAFGEQALPLADLSTLLGSLRQLQLDGKPKYRWGSAGGLYPVQMYLYVKPGRVEGLSAGTYYYHPVKHQLIPLVPNAPIGPGIHAWINQPLYEQSAFSLFLVGQLDAIAPLYGAASRDFCMLEAGLISQLLETEAVSQQIAICQVGSVDFSQVRHLFALDQGHIYLHGLIGGPMAEPEHADAYHTSTNEGWEEGEI